MIGVVLRKELKRYFTDFRMVLGLILPGLLIFLVYSLMGDFMREGNSEKITNFSICIVNEPSEFSDFKIVEGFEIALYNEPIDKAGALAKIENKELDLYIVYETNFYQKVLDYTTSNQGLAPQVEIYFNSASDASGTIYQYYKMALDTFEDKLSNRFDINAGENKYDLAKAEDVTMKIFTMMLPFLLIILLFSGCMALCSESIAGEKERGTMATLLVTPVKRGQIALGKIIALSITSLVSAVVSFGGLIASLPKLMGSTDMSLSVYGVGTYIAIFVVLVTTVLLFTVLLTLISTFAKSVKEAANYSIPLMVIVMLLGATSFMGSVAATSTPLYFIPVYNSIQCLTGILSLTVNPLNFAIAIISNLVYVSVAVFALAKMFNNEKIMFNK